MCSVFGQWSNIYSVLVIEMLGASIPKISQSYRKPWQLSNILSALNVTNQPPSSRPNSVEIGKRNANIISVDLFLLYVNWKQIRNTDLTLSWKSLLSICIWSFDTWSSVSRLSSSTSACKLSSCCSLLCQNFCIYWPCCPLSLWSNFSCLEDGLHFSELNKHHWKPL